VSPRDDEVDANVSEVKTRGAHKLPTGHIDTGKLRSHQL